MGCNLTTLFGSTEITTATPIDAPSPRKKLGWLPLLTVLFCVSYALMTMLIVEQGSTIESQRALIRELFRDSTELSASKLKAKQNQMAQAQHTPAPSAKAQNSTQNPSTQAQAPSSQAAPQSRAQNQNKQKEQFELPSRPASDLVDARRALIRI